MPSGGTSGIDAAGLEPPTQPILVSPVPSQETHRRDGCRSDGLGDEHDRATPPDGNVLSSPVPSVGTSRGPAVSDPHVKVATSPPVVRELYLRPEFRSARRSRHST